MKMIALECVSFKCVWLCWFVNPFETVRKESREFGVDFSSSSPPRD